MMDKPLQVLVKNESGAIQQDGDFLTITNSPDTFKLARFLKAQSHNYDIALSELKAGRKRSHWVWYVFPQLRGLGSSPTAQTYGINNLDEARSYLQHPVLGNRLRECVKEMNTHTGMSAAEILGEIDAKKFRSCLTLFLSLDPTNLIFSKALKAFFQGQPDQKTLELLAQTRK